MKDLFIFLYVCLRVFFPFLLVAPFETPMPRSAQQQKHNYMHSEVKMLLMFLLQAQWPRALPSFPSQPSWSTTSRWFVSTSSKWSLCPSEISHPSPDSLVRRVKTQTLILLCKCFEFCFNVLCFVFQSFDPLMWTNPAVRSTTWKEVWPEEVSLRVYSR